MKQLLVYLFVTFLALNATTVWAQDSKGEAKKSPTEIAKEKAEARKAAAEEKQQKIFVFFNKFLNQ